MPDESPGLAVGDCVTVANIGEDDAAPVRRVPCPQPGLTPFSAAPIATYRVVHAVTLEAPVMSRTGAEDLARIYCRGPEIIPGDSIFVFPTDESFSQGFRQFLCLVR